MFREISLNWEIPAEMFETSSLCWKSLCIYPTIKVTIIVKFCGLFFQSQGYGLLGFGLACSTLVW